MRLQYLFLFVLFFISMKTQALAIDDSFQPPGWISVPGDHFVVLYPESSDQDMAQEVLDHAESYYNNIADDIGYTRYQNFWTWNNRVKIIIFPDKQSYVINTGQPAWSNGFASLYSELFQAKIIVSYKDQPNFTEVLLPHEITHLVLHDFIGFGRPIPRFFDEGVAQLEQKDDSLNHMDVMARMIVGGKIIPLQQLLDYDLMAHRNDVQAISIFYIESLYIVDFLIKTYGWDDFKVLCRHLRDGDNFEDALKSTYYPTIDTMQTLQDKWSDYAKQYL